jgi:hypothetical protein
MAYSDDSEYIQPYFTDLSAASVTVAATGTYLDVVGIVLTVAVGDIYIDVKNGADTVVMQWRNGGNTVGSKFFPVNLTMNGLKIVPSVSNASNSVTVLYKQARAI